MDIVHVDSTSTTPFCVVMVLFVLLCGILLVQSMSPVSRSSINLKKTLSNNRIIIVYIVLNALISVATGQTVYNTYSVDISATANANTYTEYGGYRERRNDYYWDGYFTFTFSNFPCYRPRLRIYEYADLDWVQWKINGVDQGKLYPPNSCNSANIISDFELHTIMPSLLYSLADLQFYYIVDYGSSCSAQERIGFYLSCLFLPTIDRYP
eukprot:457511_1